MAAVQGVKMDGTAAETWTSLTDLQDARMDLGLIAAERALDSIKYAEGADITAHFKEMRTAWAKADRQGAVITDEKF
ncbi:hypothetical protein DXG01_003036 [Tephrocybe rancida]|nr:hypothetical protein DXG01_003036 [Tephrocybe rancida]